MSGLSSAMRAPIRCGTAVASVGGPAREPEVAFSDGTHGQFDLVVGADGIHSAVREAIYPGIEPAYRSFCAWRTVMEGAHWDPVFRFSSVPGCLLGSFPVGPGLVYAFLLFHCAEVPVLSRDERLARFKELAAQFRADIAALIAQQQDPARVIFVPVHEVQTPSYHRGRIVLIGDAAHGFPPLLAQGAAMAIEDAVALAESLGRSRVSTRRCGPMSPGDGRAWKPYGPRSAASRSCEGWKDRSPRDYSSSTRPSSRPRSRPSTS